MQGVHIKENKEGLFFGSDNLISPGNLVPKGQDAVLPEVCCRGLSGPHLVKVNCAILAIPICKVVALAMLQQSHGQMRHKRNTASQVLNTSYPQPPSPASSLMCRWRTTCASAKEYAPM